MRYRPFFLQLWQHSSDLAHARPGIGYPNVRMTGARFDAYSVQMMIAHLGTLVALIVVLIPWFNFRDQNSASNALCILNERFARGDICEKEITSRKTALEN